MRFRVPGYSPTPNATVIRTGPSNNIPNIIMDIDKRQELDVNVKRPGSGVNIGGSPDRIPSLSVGRCAAETTSQPLSARYQCPAPAADCRWRATRVLRPR